MSHSSGSLFNISGLNAALAKRTCLQQKMSPAAILEKLVTSFMFHHDTFHVCLKLYDGACIGAGSCGKQLLLHIP